MNDDSLDRSGRVEAGRGLYRIIDRGCRMAWIFSGRRVVKRFMAIFKTVWMICEALQTARTAYLAVRLLAV
jgi:hypothetical protein